MPLLLSDHPSHHQHDGFRSHPGAGPGEVVEQGTHTELLERRGAYAELYELQLMESEGEPFLAFDSQIFVLHLFSSISSKTTTSGLRSETTGFGQVAQSASRCPRRTYFLDIQRTKG